MDKVELTRRVKSRAEELGLAAVGVAPVSAIPEDQLNTWLARQYHGAMSYMERNTERRLDPGKILPGARSVLSVAAHYLHPKEMPYDRAARGVISRYAAGDDYHQVIEQRLQELLDFIRELDPEVQGKIYVDTGPVLDKHWASRSGIGWLGKHTNILSRQLGSWFFLGEILLNRELEYDAPGLDFCGSCTRCIDACPTAAIVEPYALDSRRCISYLTIELREDIPEEFRKAMGNLIYGCDICQEVCPWNRDAPMSRIEAFAPREINQAPELRELARMEPEEFPQRYRNSAMKRTKWRGLMRNVAVAMGNSGDPEMIPELVGLLNTADSMVRRHAAWALARIGTAEATEALRQRQGREEDPETLRILENLLSPQPSQEMSARG